MILPSFRKPPINEVVCGVRFRRLEQLMIPHIGQFWESVRGNFPNCEHAPPISIAPEDVDPDTGLPIPRVWLINSAGDRLLQIQNNIFFYNWRKRKEDKPYPRYKNIVKYFKKYFELFVRYLEEREIGSIELSSLELTYINHIPLGIGWDSPKDISKVFPDVKWRSSIKRFLPIHDQLLWGASFSLPEGMGTLNAKINQGVRRADGLPLLIFELKASDLSAGKSIDDIWNWYPIAHEWIVRGFADLTGKRVQEQIWERDDSFT